MKIKLSLLLLILTSVFYFEVLSEPHFYRSPIEKAITEAARAEGQNPTILAAICYHESNFHPEKVNKDDGGSGSYGLCQVKMALARSMGYRGSFSGMLHPEVNARIAAKILKYHSKKTRNQEELLAAYNAGRVNRWEDGTIKNIKYVRKVQRLVASFKNMGGI